MTSLRKWRSAPSKSVALQRPLGKRVSLKCLVVDSKRAREIGRFITFTATHDREVGPRGGVYYRGVIRGNGAVIGTAKWYVSAIEPLLDPHGVSELNQLRYTPSGTGESRSLGMLSLIAIR